MHDYTRHMMGCAHRLILQSFHRIGYRVAIYVLNGMIFFGLVFHYHQQRSHLDQHVHHAVRSAQHVMDDIYQTAHGGLQQHYKSIITSDYSDAAIVEVLARSAYKTGGMVRFVWADASDYIRLSSHISFIKQPVNISHREYVRLARQEPGITHTSSVMDHVSFDTRIMTISRGIYHRDSPRQYVGTIIATIDFGSIEDAMKKLMHDCMCHYRIYAHDGDIVFTQGDGFNPPEAKINGFLVVGHPDPNLANALFSQLLIQLLLISLFTLSVIYLIKRQTTERVMRPVRQALAVIEAEVQPTYMPETHIDRLSQIVDEWKTAQVTVRKQEQVIQKCIQNLSVIQSQQHHFLRASSNEMRQMHEAICDYAQLLEEQVFEKKLDPDAPYDFDDVYEMGSNLKHLSDCYHHLCTKTESKTECIDPFRLIDTHIKSLESMLERRNMIFTMHQQREVWLTLSDEIDVLSIITRSMLYVAIRHAEDDSEFEVSVHTNQNKILFDFRVSRFRQSMLDTKSQNFGMFLPSLEQDMRQSMIQTLRYHANMLIADSFAASLNGCIEVMMDSHQHGFILRLSIHAGNH